MKVDVQSPDFTSRELAGEWMAQYLRAYCPLGYGTRLSIDERDGFFIVTGSRYNSCD